MQRFITLGLIGLVLSGSATAGDGNKEILTLSKGKYVEVFDQDSIEHVGNIIFNVNTQQIIGFADDMETTAAAMMQPEVISRWLQVDPLAAKFASMSPYCAMGNNPVLYTDPDGRAFIVGDGQNTNKYDKQLFNIINARSGNVFQMNSQGYVSFKEGKSLADVKNGNGVSVKLATVVANGFKEGSQDVNFRAVGKADFDFDQYRTGKVDVSDMKAMDKNSQAALLGHYITERYATPGYEDNKEAISQEYGDTKPGSMDRYNSRFTQAHLQGNTTEAGIASDLTGTTNNGTRTDIIDVEQAPNGTYNQYLRYSDGTQIIYQQDYSTPTHDISNGRMVPAGQ